MTDWYSWLSDTTLDPSLVSEYALLFSRNELDEPDIHHFDHQFLQSMGISIAKHRLEILKLACKHNRHSTTTTTSLARLLLANTKKCLARCMRTLAINTKKRSSSSSSSSSSSGAMVVVPNIGRWRATSRPRGLLKRSVKPPRVVLMLTAGGRPSPLMSRTASPMVYGYQNSDGAGAGEDDGFWKGGGDAEEIKWDSMFQDMKPT